ncbi:SRPBCC family protein [Phytomonospora endophytica]|uniref:Putative membrane protein n=1 Tax=Phytomonospora endophytica TaxID=714109 RepID=A0A841FW27_9ACTN|nr:SRPBCC family protein [Phytomonospora endophytica]MBB6037938.1 putative membrane protein [Phytomonospora endophytica]GIG68838.1 cyclase [Phytomonospora endophytica]
MQKTYEKSIDVSVPVSRAYNQWTQFESFPRFMEGVQEVRQLSDTRTHWKTSIAGVEREFEAEIDEQHPDERIAWHSLDNPRQAGVVTFHRIDETSTRVYLQMAFEPEGAAETVGAVTGVVGGRIQGDLERFKDFIESSDHETGAWRGDISPPGQTAL